jgi:hypothetical protein
LSLPPLLPAKGVAAEPGGKAGEPTESAAAPSAAQAVAPVAAQVRKRAGKARTHSKAGPAQELAQAAGKNPKTERTRDAAQATVVAIAGAKTGPVESFRDKLRKALQASLPKPTNAADAKHAMEHGADEANAALGKELGTETETATGGLPAAANPASEVQADKLPGPPEVTLVPEEAGPSPAPVAAGPAVPEPAPPPDLSEDRAETDRAMADAGVNKKQLARSNEPEFTATLQAREDAEKEEAQRAQQFEGGQAGILAKQQGQTAGMLAGGLATMQGSRSTGLGLVAVTQTNTKSAEAKERERVTGIIEGIKNKTRDDVLQMLADMEASAKTCFAGGLAKAEKAYEDAFEEHKGGAWNWLTNWGDDWEELINTAFVVGRREYDRIVSQTIDDVAFIIENRLALAKMRVERGRREVDEFVAGLEGESKRYGDEARLQIGSDFDALDGDIDAKRDEMVTQLADQYRESQERVAAMEEKLREANKSLWQRIYDATVGIIKKIIAFKDFLLNVLARVAQVVSAIIDDPIGFPRQPHRRDHRRARPLQVEHRRASQEGAARMAVRRARGGGHQAAGDFRPQGHRRPGLANPRPDLGEHPRPRRQGAGRRRRLLPRDELGDLPGPDQRRPGRTVEDARREDRRHQGDDPHPGRRVREGEDHLRRHQVGAVAAQSGRRFHQGLHGDLRHREVLHRAGRADCGADQRHPRHLGRDRQRQPLGDGYGGRERACAADPGRDRLPCQPAQPRRHLRQDPQVITKLRSR